MAVGLSPVRQKNFTAKAPFYRKKFANVSQKNSCELYLSPNYLGMWHGVVTECVAPRHFSTLMCGTEDSPTATAHSRGATAFC